MNECKLMENKKISIEIHRFFHIFHIFLFFIKNELEILTLGNVIIYLKI